MSTTDADGAMKKGDRREGRREVCDSDKSDSVRSPDEAFKHLGA